MSDLVELELEQQRVRNRNAIIRPLLPYIRHKKGCVVGAHCEDRFCHHFGSCTCGLDDILGELP